MKNLIIESTFNVISRIDRAIFFRIHSKNLNIWVSKIYIFLFNYRNVKTLPIYLNQLNFWEVTKLENAKVVRANVVISENEEILITEQFPPINSVETNILLIRNDYYFKISPKLKITTLQKASYAFARKEELFYHAINWVLPKIINLGFFDPRNSIPNILIINQTLHWRVKEFLYCVNLGLGNNWEIIEYSDSVIIEIEQLNIVSTLQALSPQNSYLQIQHLEHLKQTKVSNMGNLQKVFLRRGKDARKQEYRNLTNIIEIENLLLSEGFTLIDLADFNLVEQIQIMENAKIIVGTHGGNFSLLPFAAQNDPILIEIFCGLISDCFEIHCGQLNIKYLKINAQETSKGYFLNFEEFSKLIKNVDPDF
jgi:hypothetical protein